MNILIVRGSKLCEDPGIAAHIAFGRRVCVIAPCATYPLPTPEDVDDV